MKVNILKIILSWYIYIFFTHSLNDTHLHPPKESVAFPGLPVFTKTKLWGHHNFSFAALSAVKPMSHFLFHNKYILAQVIKKKKIMLHLTNPKFLLQLMPAQGFIHKTNDGGIVLVHFKRIHVSSISVKSSAG